MSEQHDGWAEHRLLVLALLERHDDALEEADDRYHKQREEVQARFATLKAELNTNIEARFESLSTLHDALISKAREEIIVDLKVPTEVQVAKVTSGWQFWGLVLTSATSLIVAVIAVLK